MECCQSIRHHISVKNNPLVYEGNYCCWVDALIQSKSQQLRRGGGGLNSKIDMGNFII